jgi:hypothetical protein
MKQALLRRIALAVFAVAVNARVPLDVIHYGPQFEDR